MTARNAHPPVREAYNLFRRRSEPDLVCAVPEDRTVPEFVTASDWEFGGKTTGAPMGDFDLQAARASVRFNGFYLYHAYLSRMQAGQAR
ncbi:adenylosuccinate synthetase [Salinarimonas soli]|uniref:Adenylosuccinate synthetase n=1 Tax=Salinarimonas soli TaxID=1638099 RepID=A0A5B2VIK8_9HYPH|nr:adenylosuccinate synthetase [Salinarimonas soli]KAA2238159.1 adenylosuccinate synthetase [Salinarimonas soli]